MKFFIDTANVNEIREAYSWGVIEGVTTNPSLIAKEGREFQELVQEICTIVDGPISVETISMDTEGMVKEARALAEISQNVVVKIPMTTEGLKGIKRLKQDNIATNMTLVFSPSQALLAAKAGASYISPFVGRLDDISHVGMEIVEKIIAMYSNYDFPTEVIVASVRNPLHIVDAALMGADIVTVPFKVIEQIVKHPLTDIGIERFLADWKKVPK